MWSILEGHEVTQRKSFVVDADSGRRIRESCKKRSDTVSRRPKDEERGVWDERPLYPSHQGSEMTVGDALRLRLAANLGPRLRSDRACFRGALRGDSPRTREAACGRPPKRLKREERNSE